MPSSFGRVLNRALALALFVAFALSANVPAFAATTGNINGTITAAGGKPVAGAQITAVSPSARYSASTDARGFFSIAGVVPDTYTVTISAANYETFAVSGVTVFQDQTYPINQQLNARLQTIGRTSVRSTASAFQPSVPQDTYNVGAAQIQTQLGKKNAISESNLLISLPGASLDSSNYPVLRGGRENEEGFQFEGIDYTDAFTSQFVNSLSLNNPGQFQLSPGAGDASSGNAGTGVINLLTKRGSYPAFGSFDLEAQSYPFTHQLATEYGFASPNGRLSNYFTFTGRNQDRVYGAYGVNSADVGSFFSTAHVTARDVIDNFVYKFGKDNNQSLQALYQNQWAIFNGNLGGIDQLTWKLGDPYALSRMRTYTKLTNQELQSGLIQFYPTQSTATGQLTDYSGSIQPNETIKLQYNFAPNSASYYSLKAYRVNAVTTFRRPFNSEDSFGNYYQSLQGGLRTGVAFDAQKQLNDKHLLKFGGKYDFLHPVFSYNSPVYGAEVLGGVLGNANEIGDFVNPTSVAYLASPNCVTAPGFAGVPLARTGTLPRCGYLAANGFADAAIPTFQTTGYTNRQDSAIYVTDSWSPSAKLKADIGLREDISNYQLPDPKRNPELFAPGTTSVDNQARNPHVLQPRIAASYQLGRNDAIRTSYARSVEFAPIADVDNSVNRAYYLGLPYAKLAPTQAVCGVSGTGTCANYGDQLFWENQNFNGIPIQPVKPETFSNFDFSYSHQFPGNVALRLTPFYRRGYDALVLYATVRRDPVTGAPITDPNTGAYQFNPTVASNLGINRTTGVEFYLTKDNPGPGLSGSISATYINEFSNVIPTSVSEDFFPTIPAASALLGNVYRVGFISPFQATAAISYKTKGGWRFNPIVTYNVGYPINAGYTVASFVGSTPYNLQNTNVTSQFGASSAPAYVDTQNPGTLFNPNIAATRGTAESASPGGKLSSPRATASMAIEFSPQGGTKGSTFGVFVSNLFNQIYNQPTINSRYQPVATGIAGPQTGQTSLAQQFPGVGFTNYTVARFGQQPYIFSSNLTQPRSFNFYYQFAF